MSKIVWGCFPKMDSDPIFNCLVNNNSEYSGFFDIVVEGFDKSVQYFENQHSMILKTRLLSKDGDVVEVTDFCPKFKQGNKNFASPMLIRTVRSNSQCLLDYSNFRDTYYYCLHSDLPVSYILQEIPFVMREESNFILCSDEIFQKPLAETVREYLINTRTYWLDFSKCLHLPFELQKEIIRSAQQLRLMIQEDTGALLKSITSSIPNQTDKEVADFRYSWLKTSIFSVRILQRLSLADLMGDYLGYLINVAEVAIRKDKPIETCYSINYTKQRSYEREARCLAGFDVNSQKQNNKQIQGTHPVMIGQPLFNFEMDSVNPIGALLISLTYIFYDARLIKLEKQANFEYINRTLVKLAERAYSQFKRPLGFYLSYLKRHEEEELNQQEQQCFEEENIKYFQGKMEEILKLGISTYSLVLIWASFKSLAKLCQRVSSHSPQIINYCYDPLKDEKQKKFLIEQSQVWEERAIEVKDFIAKYGWCSKNKTYIAFIKLNEKSGKSDEYFLLLTNQAKKSKTVSYLKSSIDFSGYKSDKGQSKLTISEIEQILFSHIEDEQQDNNEEHSKLNHNPDTHLLLWPELGFQTMHDLKYKQSFQKLQESINVNPNLKVYEHFWYINILHQIDNKKARDILNSLLRQMNEAGILPQYFKLYGNISGVASDGGEQAKTTISSQGSESSFISQTAIEAKHWGNFPDSQSIVHFVYTAFKLSKTQESYL